MKVNRDTMSCLLHIIYRNIPVLFFIWCVSHLLYFLQFYHIISMKHYLGRTILQCLALCQLEQTHVPYWQHQPLAFQVLTTLGHVASYYSFFIYSLRNNIILFSIEIDTKFTFFSLKGMKLMNCDMIMATVIND